MSKKTDKSTAEEKDLDEARRAADADDEDEGHAAAPSRTARTRARAARHDDHHDHGHEAEPEVDEDEDPYWWAPHVVMSALVLVGVLGFFGMFNKVLGGLAIKLGSSQTLLPPVAAEHKESGHATTTETKPASAPPTRPAADQQREMFGAKHLLVMYKGSRRAPPSVERSKDEAKARAEEAAKKAKSGTKFEELVTEYSDEPGAGARGGDLGKFPKGAMVPEFQAGLEKLKVGEVSGVVESPFGFHVILRTQ